jgi:hypothetical protein
MAKSWENAGPPTTDCSADTGKSEKLPKLECNKADGTADNDLYLRELAVSDLRSLTLAI